MRVSQETGTINPAGSPKLTDTTSRGDHEKTPFENFESLTAKLLQVPKEEAREQARERD